LGFCVCVCVTDLDGNDLLSYWPALEECDTHTLQKWGSERPLGADYSKDAANNNQLDAALTSGDENGLTQPHRHRKGERNTETCLKKTTKSKGTVTDYSNCSSHI